MREAWTEICAVFKVAGFTHQDDVGVLPQEAAQGAGESEAHISVDRHLNQAVDVVFHGIFGRQNLGVPSN